MLCMNTRASGTPYIFVNAALSQGYNYGVYHDKLT